MSKKKFSNPFTDSETKELRSVIYNTWNYIGQDVIDGNNGKSISREEVIEVTLDAGYVEMNLSSCYSVNKDKSNTALALLKRFRTLSYDDQNAFCRENVFTDSRYP